VLAPGVSNEMVSIHNCEGPTLIDQFARDGFQLR
jgi:hypothetical protein